MKGFVPGLLDRLMEVRAAGGENLPPRMSAEQIKDSVARDLEALLNTRLAVAPDVLDAYPEARRSILSYGLADFAGYCLSSSEDRAALCASLKAAVEMHEPRLKNVSATLDPEPGSVNRLKFVIHGALQLDTGAETVNFNAVLQPSSLHYAISRGARSARS